MAAPILSAPDPGPRTTLSFGVSAGLPWELWRRSPLPELCGSIIELWAGVAAQVGERHRTLPNGEVMLMLHLSAPQRLTECGGGVATSLFEQGFVSGLHERPTTFECLEPSTRVVAARLTPLGAWRLLGGMPLTNVAGRVQSLESAFEPRSHLAETREQMLDAPDLGRALDLFEAWVVSRLREAPGPHPALPPALRLLVGGDFRTSELARACGLSSRRLRELFTHEIGLPPKRLARIGRFRRALERIARGSAGDLAGIALDCGYYDQPHLNREFRTLTGLSPRAYLRVLGEGLDGVDVVSG